jgi:archaellum component FlaC
MPDRNGWSDWQNKVLSDISEVKTAVDSNRKAHAETREDLVKLVQSSSDLKETVRLMAAQSNKYRDALAEKADRIEVNALRRQGSVVGVIGGAIGLILLWLRGKLT